MRRRANKDDGANKDDDGHTVAPIPVGPDEDPQCPSKGVWIFILILILGAYFVALPRGVSKMALLIRKGDIDGLNAIVESALKARLLSPLTPQQNGGDDAVSAIVNARESRSPQRPVLAIAAASNDARFVRLLLDHGADPLDLDEEENSVLHWATAETIPLLLDAGADLNHVGAGGQVPLHVAVQDMPASAVDTLLSHGALPNCVDIKSQTPLHWAAWSADLEKIQLLLDHGADAGIPDHKGMTALHLAAHSGDVSVIKALVKSGADVNAADESLWTPLHAASKRGHVDAVVALLEAGASAEARTIKGYSPAAVACSQWGATPEAKVAIVKALRESKT